MYMYVFWSFNFSEVQYQLYPSRIMPLEFYIKSQSFTQDHPDFPLCYRLGFTVRYFRFRTVIHFELLYEEYKVWISCFACGYPVPALLKGLCSIVFSLLLYQRPVDWVCGFMWALCCVADRSICLFFDHCHTIMIAVVYQSVFCYSFWVSSMT